MPEESMSVGEAARRLGLRGHELLELIDREQIPAVKVGGRVRVSVEEIERRESAAQPSS